MATRTTGPFAELPVGKFVTVAKVKPMGALQARKQSSGAIALYWRYSIGTSSERVTVGLYDSSAPPKSLTRTAEGYSLAAAMRAAEALAIEHHGSRDAGGRPALVAAQRKAKDEAAAARVRASTNTLRSLLDAYCDHLRSLGRTSHANARSIFLLHVFNAWPNASAQPANEISAEQIADMMRKLMDAGKARTANKLRSYVRAAYQTAKAAKSKPSVPPLFKAFDVTSNPAADTEPDESANKAAKNPLDANEMREYWHVIKAVPDFKGALLRLHLLTGGQRIEQFVRLLTADIADDWIVLHDGKGRPGAARRRHTVPLTARAMKELQACKPKGLYALSTDEGETHVANTSLSGWAAAAARDHIPEFQAKRLRSGVETLLASAGVSQDIRGRLQSHGISGVQARHYDAYEYLAEKRKALETLHRMLERADASNVTPIESRRKKTPA
jgi:integrase